MAVFKGDKKNAVKWLCSVFGKKKAYIAVLTAIQSVIGVSSVVFALILKNVIDSAVSGETGLFWRNTAALAAVCLIQISLHAAQRRLSESSRSTYENILKERLFSNLLGKDFSQVSAVHSGEWINRLTNDTVVAANGFSGIIPDAAGMSLRLIAALVMMIAIEPKFTFFLIPCAAAALVFTYSFRKKLKQLHKNIQEKDGELRVHLQESLGSPEIVRCFAAEKQTEKQAAFKMSEHRIARLKRADFSNFCSTGFSVVMNAMYLIGAAYCGYGIMKNTITCGTLMAVLQLIAQIQSPFASLSGYLPKFYAMTASAERLMEAENFDDDCPNGVMSGEEINRRYQNEFESIGFENASFAYASTDSEGCAEKAALKNITFEIKKGEYAALTGRSGCGKSTLFKLIMCLYPPDSGERYIISGGKQPLTSEWRRLFAYVPQGNRLMAGKIREIVAFSEPSAMNDDERISRALKIACADGFVNELEKGVDSMLGERGVGLSEGQTQRIAIARAVFSEHPILLLDESTSALDESTEKRLLENLRSMTDKTVIIVTHRPAALGICDKTINFTDEGTLAVSE
ncbi:MAG: ABC transporter ATP-binding protein [Oscillospiraceae bacterium]